MCAVSTVSGPITPTAGYTEGAGASARFSSPRGVVVDGAGYELYVADSVNNRVRAVVIASGATRVLSGSGVAASTDGTGAGAAHSSPFALALSSAGQLYVTDRGSGRIRRVAAATGAVATIAGTGTQSRVDGVGTASATFSAPSGLALDEAGGLLYVSDCVASSTLGAVLRRLNLATGQVTTLAGQGAATAAYLDGVGTNAKFQVNMYSPLLVGALLYLTDSASNRLRVMNTSSLLVSTVAGSGASADASGVGLAASFKGVDGLVANASGWLFAIELNGGTLRRVNNRTLAVDTLAFTGAVGNADGACATATINSPQFLALDRRTGNVFITDTANHNIRAVVTVPASSTASPTPSASPSPPPCFAPPGSFCNGSVVTPCPPGTFAQAGGTHTACAVCLEGHFCPSGTASAARMNCGVGHFCAAGAAAPRRCPTQLAPPPFAAWEQHPLRVQGPAFLVETAACLNHCFWNFSSGDGALSRC